MSAIHHFFAGVVLMMITAQCQAQNQPALSGNIALSPGFRTVAYLVQPRSFPEIASSFSGVVVDSAMIGEDGSFAFLQFQAPETATFYELVVQPENSKYTNKLTDETPVAANYFPVVLQKGSALRLRAQQSQLLNTGKTATNDLDNSALQELIAIRIKTFNQFHRLLPGDPQHDDTAVLEAAARLEGYRQPLIAFANTTHSYWAALLAVRWVSPESDYERVPEFLHQQCARWQKTQPDQAFTAQLCALSAPGKLPLMIGDTVPDFGLPMENGDTLSLYKIRGKKLTVIDLWASWCAPCRRENRQVLLPIWEKYKEDGLQIVGYALDSNAGAWKAAIEKDGAVWAQSSHLSGDSSPFLDALHVTTIPANFIIDSHGKIIARNVHGEALGALVGKMMSEE